ncbi:MAG: glycosyltransferase family 39 protein [Proteobacteria bacterium]|nr:glycosyltransferase family 39 protein [Pseudomonadota bacterium]HQR04780.1 glycosyltransferase family 39 protein [Rhodocyclaceae bacterium]
MTPPARDWGLPHALILLLPLLLIFYGLGAFGLLNNVEGMYAEIAREMQAGGSWIVPHLDGLPYIEKPPLLYWLAALSMSVFGVSDWAVRLVPALAGVASLACVYFFGSRMAGRRFGLLSAVVLGSSAGFVMMSKVALTDGLLSALLNGALLLTYLGLRLERRAFLRLALVCLALAILTKGFVALALYGLVGVSYLIACRRADWRRVLAFLLDPWAWGLFLLVAVPWHVAASLEQPGFAWFYFINEHLLRFLGLREPKDYYSGSVFYYLPRLAAMALPWMLLPLLAVFRRFRNGGARDDLDAFLWCCLLAPLVFFSVSSAKANYYVLVCQPALALILARWLDRRWARGGLPVIAGVLVLVSVPLVLALVSYAGRTEASFSARAMAGEVQRQPEVLPVFLYQDFEDYSALPFYLARPIGSVDEQSADLRFALKTAKDQERFPSLDQFLARKAPAYLVVLDARVRHGMPPALMARLRSVARHGNATLYRLVPH